MKNPFAFEDHQSRLRLIPEIDKSDFFINLANTSYGRVIFVMINIIVLWSFQLYMHWSVAVLCLFIGLYRGAAPIKFLGALLWVSFFGLRDVEFDVWNFGEVSRIHISEQISAIYLLIEPYIVFYRLFNILVCTALFCFIGFLTKKIATRYSILWFYFFWIFLLLIADIMPASTTQSVFAWGLFGIYARCFFAAIYLHQAQIHGQRVSWQSQILFPLQGALLGTGNNFLRNPAHLESVGVKHSMNHPAVFLLKSTKLLIWTRVITFFADMISWTTYGRVIGWVPQSLPKAALGWTHPVIVGFDKYNEMQLPLYQAWVAILLHSLNFIVILCSFSGVMIALLRMGGVYVLRDTCRPYLSVSFNDFLRRVLFYYSEILVNIFIFPTWAVLRPYVSHKSLRLFVTLFLTVGLGGWIVHIVFMPGYFVLTGGAKQGFAFFVRWIPYFTIVGLASAISASGLVKKWLDPWLPKILRMPLIYVFYSLLLVTAHGYPLQGDLLYDWQARCVFIARLFGFGG